ncbi:hypothetical protein KIL84_014390 [Mauremys mutica]|uniref:Uncharacterized protein n=1 Tax=Mauremys mutica TaxID=74926 RepID=A0A9D3XLN4_9SAUR|nr:hypothetical protein KIL84_014390 [Mauremys mutica]
MLGLVSKRHRSYLDPRPPSPREPDVPDQRPLLDFQKECMRRGEFLGSFRDKQTPSLCLVETGRSSTLSGQWEDAVNPEELKEKGAPLMWDGRVAREAET